MNILITGAKGFAGKNIVENLKCYRDGRNKTRPSLKIGEIFDLRPYSIEERLKLRYPIYEETAAYGHMGRQPQVITKCFKSYYEGDKDVTVELFTWEKLDYVDKIKEVFHV